jgi:hypothetical protein
LVAKIKSFAHASGSATAWLGLAASRTKWYPNRIHSVPKAPPQHRIHDMDEEQAAHHLLNVLEERGLDVDLDKILLGFEDTATKHEAAAWVEEHLHEDTLLTREELELYYSPSLEYL